MNPEMEQKKSKLIFYDSMRSSNNGDHLVLKPGILKKLNKKFQVKPTILKKTLSFPDTTHARKQKFVEKSGSQLEVVHDQQAIEEEMTIVIDLPTEGETCDTSEIIQDEVEENYFSQVEEVISTPEVSFIKQELEENAATVELSSENNQEFVIVLPDKDKVEEINFSQVEEVISTPEMSFIKQEIEENEKTVKCPENNQEIVTILPTKVEEEFHIPYRVVQSLGSNMSFEASEEFISHNSNENIDDFLNNIPCENREEFVLNSTSEMEGEFVIESLGPEEISESYYDKPNGLDQDNGSNDDSEPDDPMDFPQHFMVASTEASYKKGRDSVSHNLLADNWRKSSQASTVNIKTSKRNITACLLCRKTYCNRVNLLKHFRKVHKGLSADRDNKMISKPSDVSYVCFPCDASFDNSVMLKKHQEIVHQAPLKPALKCVTCNRGFILAENLSRHAKLCHKLKELSKRQQADTAETNMNANLKCPFCPKTLKSSNTLDTHIQMVHLYPASQRPLKIVPAPPPLLSDPTLVINDGIPVSGMDGNNFTQDKYGTNLVQTLSENSTILMPNYSEGNSYAEEIGTTVVQSLDGSTWVIASEVGPWSANEGESWEPVQSWSQPAQTPVNITPKVAIPRLKPPPPQVAKSKASKFSSKPKEGSSSSSKFVKRDRGWLRKLQTPNYQEDNSESESDSS